MTIEDDRLYSLIEAATSPDSPLAGRACTRTLSALVARGDLAAVRVGRRIYLTAASMRDFIARGGAANTTRPPGAK